MHLFMNKFRCKAEKTSINSRQKVKSAPCRQILTTNISTYQYFLVITVFRVFFINFYPIMRIFFISF